MKTFVEWIAAKNEGLADHLPNLGQRAIPIQRDQPQKVSLSTLADTVQDLDWHKLYDVFTKQYRMNPADPQVAQLGQSLYQAAQNGDMSSLQPFKQKHIYAQRV